MRKIFYILICLTVVLVGCSKKEEQRVSKSVKTPASHKDEKQKKSEVKKKGLFSKPKKETKVDLEKIAQQRDMMGTYVLADVCYVDGQIDQAKQALDLMWQRLEDIAFRMSKYEEKSDVSKINDSYQNPVVVGGDTYWLIQKSIELNKTTNGAFDITIAPLAKLWKSFSNEKVAPLRRDIKAVQEAVGVDKIQLLQDNRVVLTHPQTRIDLGGIAKGYAIDEAVRVLREQGLDQFLIDAGGDVFVSGQSCTHNKWQIGVRNPIKQGELFDVVLVENQAVTTSGDYEQFLEIQGNHFSHIINPITGYPQTTVSSSTIVASNAMEADVLSTAASVLGGAQALELINSLSKDAGVLVLEKLSADKLKQFSNPNYQSVTRRNQK